MRCQTLYAEGRFYRGNLHTHTTLSDGANTPEEVVACYRDALHHDFLALTDHRLYKKHSDLSTENFLLLPGVELNTIPTADDRADHHVVGIGVEGEADLPDGYRFDDEFTRTHDCQGLIDTLRAHGCIPIFCHPYWSATSTEEGKTLKNVCGMEIMNYACETAWHCGASDAYYDAALWANNPMWCFATDDSHAVGDHQQGGWIAVKCAALTNRDITRAIRDGSFYATTGPEIYDFYVDTETRTAHLDCSPAREVYFVSIYGKGRAFGTPDAPVTTYDCDLPVPGGWRVWPDSPAEFLRAVVVDFEGRTAWSQPIFFGK